MSLRLTVRETFERNLADVRVPDVDLDAVRRAGRRPRQLRAALMLLAILLGSGVIAGAMTIDRQKPLAAVDPGTVPVMDFAGGLRGFYDGGNVYLGGQHFPVGLVRDLDASAEPTPYGLVFFSPDQGVRLLNAAGRVQTLAQPPAEPRRITPTVAFDAYVPMVAWTTRSADGVEVVVYRFDAQPGLFNRYPVPCSGKACEQVRLAAFDIGKIFITGADGSQVLDPSMGPDAHWAKVTDGRIVDVRNRVIIVDGARSMKLPAGADLPGWRMLPAATPTSVLTLEGGRQTDGTTTLQPTLAGVAPLALSVPSGPGRTAMRLDNDGSLLVGRVQGDGDRYWDCDLTGACLEIGFVPGGMNPRFLGD